MPPKGASYNNHWGVPLTLARMPADADFAVIEIGARPPAKSRERMADLDVALITIVAAAHLEAFGDLAGIAHEKAAIFEGLRARAGSRFTPAIRRSPRSCATLPSTLARKPSALAPTRMPTTT